MIGRYNENGRHEILYEMKDIEKLISEYNDLGGKCYKLEQGLYGGYGLAVCKAPEHVTYVITEVILNGGWPFYKVKKYDSCPAKYEKMIEKYEKESEVA